MRIAIVNESFEEARGGAERCALDLSRALEARGHAVERLSRDPRRGRISGQLALERAAARARVAFERTVSLTRAQGDILAPQGGVDAAAEAGAVRARGWASRSLSRVSSLVSPKRFVFRRAERRAVRGARRFVALSRMVRDDMVARWRIDAARIDVIPNGCDVARFRPAGADERAAARGKFALGAEEAVLLLLTHNWRLRGLAPLLEAFSGLAGKWRLLLAGRDAPHDAVTTPRVRALGPLEDPRPAYAAADLLVHPTFYDPCSLVTLEALACGLPVVTTRWNGAAELFSGDEGTVLDTPRDVAALRAAIEALAAPDRRSAAGKAARATAERHPKDAALARLCDAIERAAP